MQELLSYGPQPATGVSPPTRVPDGARVRLVCRATLDGGPDPVLSLVLERLPVDGAFGTHREWQPVTTRRFGGRPIVFDVPDAGLGVRVRWEAKASFGVDPALQLGITAEVA